MASYPNAPGHQGTDTSREAAEAIAPHLCRLQKLSLAAYECAGEDGLTSHELAEEVRMPIAAIQPRPTELKRLGLITDSKRRRLNASGKKAMVLVITAAGLRFLAKN